MMHDLIFVKDKDFTGLKYIDEIKTLIKIIKVLESQNCFLINHTL
jgi:hypothetical protein